MGHSTDQPAQRSQFVRPMLPGQLAIALGRILQDYQDLSWFRRPADQVFDIRNFRVAHTHKIASDPGSGCGGTLQGRFDSSVTEQRADRRRAELESGFSE